MIVPRKYEWLGLLYENDSDSKTVIDKAFESFHISAEQKVKLLDYNHCNISAFLNLGCGIPGEVYASFMKDFEALDKTSPYDNGLTFNDVSSIEYETSRKGSAIQMSFITQMYDSPYRIVGFAAIDNEKGVLKINKGWTMTAPFEIG